ncbi:SufS family cysteine desulfurase [Streptomyces sp. 1222.5]|uniref:SufS family cysteine desulfurase n=1 Tax=Streptomyces sp. 1222.5 TaxID=1881026 RepID=UPI003EC0F285
MTSYGAIPAWWAGGPAPAERKIHSAQKAAQSLAERYGHGIPSAAPSLLEYIPDTELDGSGLYFLSDRQRSLPSGYSLDRVRTDFPALQQKVNGHRLVWLDNAATTHKPQSVINRVRLFYENENSNVHRAAHTLAARATAAYEDARSAVASFLGASTPREIVFVRGATEGINLVANSGGQRFVQEGDEIVVSELEHHSNIVPWQLLCQRTGAKLRVLPVDDDGDIQIDALERIIGPHTRFVAITQLANTIGTIVPVCLVSQIAHAYGALVVVDGAQSAGHLPVNVGELGADFFVLSGHKIYGPTGIGALYAKEHLLESMPPWQGGGSMIDTVTFDHTTYASPPAKFEAGTGHLAGAVGLATALEYVDRLGRPALAAHEQILMQRLLSELNQINGLHIVANPALRSGSVSFWVDGIPTQEVGRRLDKDGIAVRAGHHCAQPLLRRFGLTSTVRASLAVYNCADDIDTLAASLRRLARSV